MAQASSGGQPDYNRPMHAREWALLFTIAVLWGAAFFFVAIAVKEIPPLTLGAIRLLLGGSLLVCILYASGGRLPFDRQSLKWFAIMAFVNSLAPIYLIGWAQQYIGAGLNAILNGALPLWTLFIAHLLTREEKLTGTKLAGTLIGFAGVAAMVGFDALKGMDRNLMAQLASVLSTIFFAFGNVFGRRFRAIGVPPLAATAGTLMTSGLMFLPLAIYFDQPWLVSAPGASALSAAIAAGLLSTAAGHFLFFPPALHGGRNQCVACDTDLGARGGHSRRVYSGRSSGSAPRLRHVRRCAWPCRG